MNSSTKPTWFHCCSLGNKQTRALLPYWHSCGSYHFRNTAGELVLFVLTVKPRLHIKLTTVHLFRLKTVAVSSVCSGCWRVKPFPEGSCSFLMMRSLSQVPSRRLI
ncbi:hypothetical protein OJAV_G00204360 [Oryzias javanicus]|uniref:Uncharacterized protein n=1 Tax=Oryzias javanicus TaxID=123683 RepID=A0A3S2PCN8_ORYJA|nr:hypothetical protein OJAV_G00204360 [Oryzias javanicus]